MPQQQTGAAQGCAAGQHSIAQHAAGRVSTAIKTAVRVHASGQLCSPTQACWPSDKGLPASNPLPGACRTPPPPAPSTPPPCSSPCRPCCRHTTAPCCTPPQHHTTLPAHLQQPLQKVARRGRQVLQLRRVPVDVRRQDRLRVTSSTRVGHVPQRHLGALARRHACQARQHGAAQPAGKTPQPGRTPQQRHHLVVVVGRRPRAAGAQQTRHTKQEQSTQEGKQTKTRPSTTQPPRHT